MKTNVWADGFGVWHAEVSADLRDPRRAAIRAIRHHVLARGEARRGWRCRVDEIKDSVMYPPKPGVLHFREV